MAATIANLSVMLGVNTSGLTRGFSSASRQAQQFSSGLGGGLDSGLGGLAAGVAGLGATVATAGLAAGAAFGAAGAGLLTWGVMVSGQFEQTQMAFEVMLGSAEKGKQFMDDLFSLAAKTPFEFKDLTAGSQRLLAFGFQAEQILPLVERLGNLAGASPKGMAEGFDRITLAVGQMHGKQRVMSQEMNQLTEAGIPAWKALAEALGTDVATAMNMVEKRGVSSATGINAILALAESDKFSSLMQRQSQTLFGLWSTLKDNFTLMLRDIGDSTVKSFSIKEIIAGMTQAMGWIRANIIPAVTTIFTFVGRIAQVGFELSKMFLGRIAEIYKPLWEDIVGVIGPLLEQGNSQMGGFIDRAKAGFQAFLDWMTPYWKATVGVLRGAWDALVTTVSALFGSETVKGGIENMRTNFSNFATFVAPLIEKVRNALIMVAIGAEFAFRNMGDISALAFETVKLNVLNLVISIQDTFHAGLPGVINFMASLFGRVFDAILAKARDTFLNLVSNMGSVLKNAHLIATGALKFDEVWQPLKEGLQVNMEGLPEIAGGGIRAMAAEAEARQAELLNRLKPGWDEFFAKRWDEVFKPEGRGAIGDFFAYAGELGKRGIAEGDRVWQDELKRRGEAGADQFRLPGGEGPGAKQGGIFTRLADWAAKQGAKRKELLAELPNAFVRGSSDAVSAINRASVAGQALDAQREIAENGKQQLGMLGRIFDAIKENAPVQPEVV